LSQLEHFDEVGADIGDNGNGNGKVAGAGGI
jgi:3,4-dihydroxy 2-butanone 4-phosphate synthase/GTP cyclohydrolase II